MSAITRTPHGSPRDPSGSPALVGPDRAAELTAASRAWPSILLTRPQLAGLELLLLGAFGPVAGYARESLRDGLRTPTLAVPAEDVAGVRPDDTIALRDPEGVLIAVLHVSVVQPSAADPQPTPGRVRLAGRLEGLRLPRHPDYPGLRLRPGELRALLRERGWLEPGGSPPWAVWADGLLHTADVARIRALTRQGKRCVVLAPTGGADPADPRHHLRVRALHAALDALDEPLRPTEATLAGDAIAAEATHVPVTGARFSVSAAVAPAGADRTADAHPAQAPHPLDAQPGRALLVLVPVEPSAELAAPREPGITATSPFGAPAGGDPGEPDRLAELTTLRAHVAEFYGLGGSITGPALGAPGRDELAALLATGRPIPTELTPPGVAAELARAYPPRHARGFAVWISGPAASGVASLARLLAVRLLERGDRHVTLLGDEPARIGFVAAEVAAADGVVVCAPGAPTSSRERASARELVGSAGAGFVLVRLPGGGEAADAAVTGAEPAAAEVTIDTAEPTADAADAADAAVDAIVTYLRAEGWLLA